MKHATLALAARPASCLTAPAATTATTITTIRPLLHRFYATQTGLGKSQSPGPRRRGVTPFNDDGRVPWTQLSKGEKAARATQQSFNFGLILAGLGLTVRLNVVAPFHAA